MNYKPKSRVIARKIIEFPLESLEKVEKFQEVRKHKSFKDAVLAMIDIAWKKEEVEVEKWWKEKLGR